VSIDLSVVKRTSNMSPYIRALSSSIKDPKPRSETSKLLNDLRYLAWYLKNLLSPEKYLLPQIDDKSDLEEEIVDEGVGFAPTAMLNNNGKKNIKVKEGATVKLYE
jgi:hypothetical protein